MCTFKHKLEKIKKSNPRKFLIFKEMELSSSKVKKFLINQEMELSSSKIKNFLIFSEMECPSLIFSYISGSNFPSLKK